LIPISSALKILSRARDGKLVIFKITLTQKNIIFKLRKQSLALIGTLMAVWQPAFTALFTRKQQGIQQTSIVIRSKKMVRRSRDGISRSPRLFNQKSKIKNLKSIVGRAKPRFPRRSREGISNSPRLFNQKSKID
jgi:hypothetical protein